MATSGNTQEHGAWDTSDVLFDPLSMSQMSTSSNSYGRHHVDMQANSSHSQLRDGSWARQGRFRGVGMRLDEDESHYLETYLSGVARVLSVMQIIMGVVIILLGIFAYVAKATIGPLIPAMDIGCGFVLYITGGVLGMFSKCRAKRMVAAFMILSACSLVASSVLGSIHSMAAFKTRSICAYLHCGGTPEESPRKVMDALIAILSFLESIFALGSMIVGFHGFCKCCRRH